MTTTTTTMVGKKAESPGTYKKNGQAAAQPIYGAHTYIYLPTRVLYVYAPGAVIHQLASRPPAHHTIPVQCSCTMHGSARGAVCQPYIFAGSFASTVLGKQTLAKFEMAITSTAAMGSIVL